MFPSGPLFWIIALLNLFGFFWLVVVGFRRHWGWGLAVLLVPFALLVFAIMYWEDAKKPFLLYLVTTVFVVYQMISMAMTQGAALIQATRESGAPASSIFGDPGSINQARTAAEMAMQQIEAMHRAGLISDEELAQLRTEHEANMAALGYDGGDTGGTDTAPIEEGDIAADVAEAPPPRPAATGGKAPAQQTRPDKVAKVDRAAPAPKPKRKKRRTGKIDVSEAHRYIGRQFIITDTSGRTRLATLASVSDGRLEFQRRMRTGAMTFDVYENDITNLVLK